MEKTITDPVLDLKGEEVAIEVMLSRACRAFSFKFGKKQYAKDKPIQEE